MTGTITITRYRILNIKQLYAKKFFPNEVIGSEMRVTQKILWILINEIRGDLTKLWCGWFLV